MHVRDFHEGPVQVTGLLTKLIAETSSGKNEDYTEEEKEAIPQMAVPLIRFFSLFPDTIFFANEANINGLNGEQARQFFKSIVPKRYRKGTWPRKDEHEVKQIEMLAMYLQVSYERARELLPYTPSYIIDAILIQETKHNNK